MQSDPIGREIPLPDPFHPGLLRISGLARKTFICASVVVNLVTIFIVDGEMRANQQRQMFRTHSQRILMILVTGLVLDIYLHILLDPVLIFPCMYDDGLLFHWFGVSTEIQMVKLPVYNFILRGMRSSNSAWGFHESLAVLLFYSLQPPYYASFLQRQQAVLLPDSSYKVSDQTINQFCLFIYLLGGVISVHCYVSLFDQTEKSWFFEQRLRNYSEPIAERITCIASRGIWFILNVGLNVTIVIVSISVICAHTFYNLKRNSTLSVYSRNFNRRATYLLLTQILVPATFLILPCAFLPIQFFLHVNDRKLITLVILHFFSLHSLMAATVLLLGSPSYRLRLLKLLSKLFSPHASVVQGSSSSQNARNSRATT